MPLSKQDFLLVFMLVKRFALSTLAQTRLHVLAFSSINYVNILCDQASSPIARQIAPVSVPRTIN